MNRARVASVAFTAATLIVTRVSAGAVPVPPPAWTPAAGLLILVLLAVTLAATVGHHRKYRNRTDRTTTKGEEA